MILDLRFAICDLRSAAAVSARAVVVAALVCGAWGAAGASAGTVQSLGDRLTGAVAFAAGEVSVGGKKVAWEQVVSALVNPDSRTLPQPHVARLTDGQVWAGAVLSLSAKQLEIDLPVPGVRKLDQARLRALDFLPDLGPLTSSEAEGLSRSEGEPVPGTLMWIDARQLAIDSPLGVLTLPREGARRYLFPNKVTPADTSADEVALLDGGRYRGKLVAVAGGVELDSALIGKVTIPAAAIRFLVRHPAGVVDLVDQPPAAVEAVPLLVEPLRPEWIDRAAARPEMGDAFDGSRGIRIFPKTTLKYRLPAAAGARVFRATLQPVAAAQGDAKLKITAAGQTVLERTLGPREAPAQLALALPAGDDLVIEVDLGDVVRFPSGIVLGDPHCVTTTH